LRRSFVLEVLFGLAARHLVERRLGDVEVPALDQLRHLPEEEGQQQRADMGAVHVSIGHDDDLVVAQLVGVELILADTGAKRRDQRADFLARQHLVEPRPLDIEDLAALSGRIAWFSRERPCLAEPPAESPSTRNSSDLAGSRS
jgi:hypothetical protein